MPASIGPLGPLLAEPAQSRSEPSEPGRGTAFAKILETSGRAGNASAEEERDQSDRSGNTAALAFSATTHVATDDTSAEDTDAPVEETAETAELVSGVAPQVPATANMADADAEDIAEGDRPAGEALTSEAAAPKTVAATAELPAQNADSAETTDSLLAKSDAEAAHAARSSSIEADTALNDEATGDAKALPAPVEPDATDIGTVSQTATGDVEATDIDAEKFAELKAEKAERRDNAAAIDAQLKSNEAPGRPDLVMASLNPAAKTEDREAGRLKDIPAAGLPERAARAEAMAAGTPRMERPDTQPSITIPQVAADNMMESASFLSGGLEITAQATSAGDSGSQTSALSLTAGAAPAAAPITASTPAANAPAFGAMMAPMQATVVAAPQEIVDIVSNKLTGGDKPDRILVQLDPPELGRVSIEFKFDAQGLQQVAVRADTPEAMKQLRLLHFDLVQSLEQHGLSARDMTFSEGSANGSQNQQPADFIDYTNIADDDAASMPPPAMLQTRRAPITIGASGLNIKL